MEVSLFKAGLNRLQTLARREAPVVLRHNPAASRAAEKALMADVLALTKEEVVPAPEIAGRVFKRIHRQGGIDGGYNPKQIMGDQTGLRWLFKGLFYAGENYRAVGDKVGGDIANAVGLKTPELHLTVQTLNGQQTFGTLQRLMKHTGRRLPHDPARFTNAQKDQLTASHVVRWLIGDHDGKTANFLLLKKGDLMPIDFGNMFRFFPNDKLERTYAPNRIQPVYVRMWDAFVKGRIDLNFSAAHQQIAKIEALSDDAYLKLLAPYADSLYATSKSLPPGLPDKASFMKAALSRKQNIRRDLTTFYGDLKRERALFETLKTAA